MTTPQTPATLVENVTDKIVLLPINESDKKYWCVKIGDDGTIAGLLTNPAEPLQGFEDLVDLGLHAHNPNAVWEDIGLNDYQASKEQLLEFGYKFVTYI